MKASKKILARTIYKEEKWRNGEKKALYNLRMPKLQEIFTTVSIECPRYEGLGVLQNIFAIILLWARKDVVKTSVTHSPATRLPLLCFYDILTSSVIYYWTDARQHGIYLLTRTYPTPDFKGRFWNQKVHPHHPWSSRRGSQSTVFTMPAIFACA